MICEVTICASTNPEAIVLATAVPCTWAPKRLVQAARMMARRGKAYLRRNDGGDGIGGVVGTC